MKSLLLILLGCLLCTVGAQAAQLENGVFGDTPHSLTWSHARAPITITQNTGSPITCNAGGYVCGSTTSPYYYNTDDWAMRRYIFADDAITTAFTVLSVDYAVRYFRYNNLVTASGPYTVTCYTLTIPDAAAMTFENMTELTHTDIAVDNTFVPFSAHNVAVGGTIADPNTDDLVVAFFMPITYYLTPQFRYSPGADNAGGDTREAFYAFADCGAAEPSTPTELGGAGAAKLIEVINGDYFVPVLGSCCAPDGSCTVVEEAQCVAPSIWTLNGVCDPNTCPMPQGACCDPATGACTMLLQAECQLPLIWHSDWTCSPNQCPVPFGSCCMPDGSCTVTTRADCQGIWTLDGVCVPNTCDQPVGACCDAATGACTFVQEAQCAGHWLGMGTVCAPNPCPQPTGGCCTTGVCTQVVQTACGGTWLGVGVICNTSNCTPPTPVEHKSWGQVKHSYR